MDIFACAETYWQKIDPKIRAKKTNEIFSVSR